MNKTELEQFHGTEQYHRFSPFGNIVATDGIIYLFNNASCFWLGDIVASVQTKEKIKENRSFIVWKIKKNNEGCIVDAHKDCDENGNFTDKTLLYKQEVEHTDFPFDELGETFEFYQCDNVLLLKSEY